MTAMTSDGRMPLMDHLRELRNRIVKVLLAVAFGAIICWIFYNQIIDILLHPYCSTLSDAAKKSASEILGSDGGCKLLNTDPLAPFSLRVTIASYGGIVIAIPVILWQVWRFIAPGLHAHEKRFAVPFVVTGVVLFLMGGGLAFWSIPRALDFLINIGGPNLVSVFSPKPYLSFVVKMIVAFGIGFEFPLVLCFLQMLGVVQYTWLSKYRRHAAVGITALVAVITPSGDPITLIVMSVPMYLFYEASILYGRWWTRKRRKRAALA
jgi:sec-independent protein translocase protein TatC